MLFNLSVGDVKWYPSKLTRRQCPRTKCRNIWHKFPDYKIDVCPNRRVSEASHRLGLVMFSVTPLWFLKMNVFWIPLESTVITITMIMIMHCFSTKLILRKMWCSTPSWNNGKSSDFWMFLSLCCAILNLSWYDPLPISFVVSSISRHVYTISRRLRDARLMS